MASVVFIIRIPFEGQSEKADPKSKKIDPDNSTGSETQEACQLEEKDIQNPGVNTESQTVEESSAIESNLRRDTSKDDNVEFASPISIAEVLQNVLKSLNIEGDSWQITNDKQFHQVIFLEEGGTRVEKILNTLTDAGIGRRPKSSVSVIPTSVHIQFKKPENKELRASASDSNPNTEEETQPLLVEKESAKDSFIKSIKSRLTVEQVVEGVKMQTRLTFDYVMFTVLASLIAAVGLAEDNAVVLVASMLVSPLMGPILGGTFGTVINNRTLRNTGLKTEGCGLAISILVGFLFGFICGPFGLDGVSWNLDKDSWPTQEMSSRGMLRSLWVGMLIALPSGAGVALSVLGGNAGSLVGVAISASLLPPAVNSGMLWAYSIICGIKHPTLLDSLDEYNKTNRTQGKTLGCPTLKDNSYAPVYSCNMAEEAAIMAIVSLTLTIVNIVCILVTATAVLKIKEVTPIASSSNATQKFWTKDIKVAREAYATLQGKQATDLKTTFLKEWKKISNSGNNTQNTIQKQTELLDVIEEVEEDEGYQAIVARAPRGQQYIHQFSRNLKSQISGEHEHDEDDPDPEAMKALFHLMTIHNQYTAQAKDGIRQRPVETLFQQTPELKPKPRGRDFVVTDIEKPHHSSVVRVRPPNEDSEKYSVLTESGV